MRDSDFEIFKAVLLVLSIGLFPLCFLNISESQGLDGTSVRVQPSATGVQVGETFSVSVVIEAVENLYGLDVTLRWNSSVLRVQSVDVHLGVESHPDGVLHEDSGTEIYVAQNNMTEAEYHLAATAVSPASSFNGSGTAFEVSFKAVNLGLSPLDLETELADHPAPGGTANLIEHAKVAGLVESTEKDYSAPIDVDWVIILIVAIAIVALAVGLIFFLREHQKQNSKLKRNN